MKTINIEEELKKPLPDGVIYDPISKTYNYMCHCVICGREMGNYAFSREDVVLAEAGMKTILCEKCGKVKTHPKTKHRLPMAERELIADVELMKEIDFDDDDWERDYIVAVDKSNEATT